MHVCDKQCIFLVSINIYVLMCYTALSFIQDCITHAPKFLYRCFMLEKMSNITSVLLKFIYSVPLQLRTVIKNGIFSDTVEPI